MQSKGPGSANPPAANPPGPHHHDPRHHHGLHQVKPPLVETAIASFHRTEVEARGPEVDATHESLARELEMTQTRCKALFEASGHDTQAEPGGGGADSSRASLDLSSSLEDVGELAAGGEGAESGGAKTPSSTVSDTSSDDWALEQYRRERLDEIMRRSGHSTPLSSSFAGSTTVGGGMPLSPPSADPSGGGGGSGTLFLNAGGATAGASPQSGPTTGRSRRGSISSPLPQAGGGSGASWLPAVGRLTLTPDQLELCKRLDAELKQYYSSFHYSQIDRQYLIRVVHCKKTFDRALKMCLELCTDVLDRYGLGHLQQADVESVLSRNALFRVDPAVCCCREDGSSLFYVVGARLAQPELVEPTELVRTILYIVERTRAFEGRISYVIDLAGYPVKPQNAKQLTQLAEALREALEGKYPAQVSKFYVLLDPKNTGPMTTVLMKGILVKALSSWWRERTIVAKSLEPYVTNLSSLRRALYDALGV